jgi:cyclophilin family peptidyl-prolyl cis-trans isomerase
MLASLSAQGDGEAGPAQRLARLRCAAADILAGSASLSKQLVACDPNDGRVGALAVVEVLGRAELTGARGARWRALATHDDPKVALRALSLLPTHPEAPDAAATLASALGRPEPGVVATAARLILEYPHLVTDPSQTPKEGEPGRPSAAVIDALSQALDVERPPDQIETRGLLLRAAARLGSLSVKVKAEADCQVDNPTVRRHAELALAMLGAAASKCPTSKRSTTSLEMSRWVDAPVTLTFVTESKRLGMTLDPVLAPMAVTRLVELARAGFFDGMPIHRVVEGQVVQFGDPTGDGYGGAGKAPLPSETSPVPFEALSVGMALAGRDTGSSQVFVNLVSQPELDGDYPLLGHADAEWHEVTEGETIRQVVVKE